MCVDGLGNLAARLFNQCANIAKQSLGRNYRPRFACRSKSCLFARTLPPCCLYISWIALPGIVSAYAVRIIFHLAEIITPLRLERQE